MAIEQELRLLLEYARIPGEGAGSNKAKTNRSPEASNQEDEADAADLPSGRVAAREIYGRLLRAQRQHVLPTTSIAVDVNLPELLALVAEAAVYQQDFEVARSCVEWFLSDCAMKNQFYCRIQLVRAHCASNDAAHDTGAAKLRKVLNAIHFILLVLPVATDPKRRPQYDFLVYNASVTYWHIARQLMKKTTFQYLLPSLGAIVDGLKTVGENDVVWQLRLKLCLVYGQIDANQFALCAKTICEIVDTQLTPLLADATVASDPSFKAIYEEALRLQVHVGSFKDPECQKILANMKKGSGNKRMALVTKLQALKSGAFSGTVEAALSEIFQEVTSMTTFAVATTSNDEIIAHLRGLETEALHNVDAEITADAGIIAAFRGEYRLAGCFDVVLQTKGKNMDPKFRVLHQVLRAIMLALVPPTPEENYKLSRSQRAALVISRRSDGVKAIERALLACKRQQDPNLMESVCLYAWNLSLPLLQPSLRGQVSRLFSQAAIALEELQSLQLNLRVRLLLEVAKLELQSEFVAKAQDATSKALALDYATTGSATATTPTLDELTANPTKWLRRPLDVHLVPLKKRLDRKLAFEDPSNAEEELASAVEQLREAKDDSQRRRQVDRVLVVMKELQQQRNVGTGTPPNLPLELLLNLNTTTSLVWHDLKDHSVARALVQETLQLFFPVGAEPPSSESENVFCDKSVMLLEVDLRLRLVEMIGFELKERAQRFASALAQQASLQSGKKRSQSSSMASRGHTRKQKAQDETDADVLLLLSRESFALGLTASTPVVPPSHHDESAEQRRAAMEAELQQQKMSLLQELTLALQVSTRVGWAFVVENTAVYLWNYHFHVFRLLLTDGPQPIASTILLECISAFESTLSALEALPLPALNLDLMASIALGLALTQEKLGKLDKAVAIADGILKRLKASATALPPPSSSTATSISVLFLKRFAELKIRIQIQQNAKEIQPVDATPPLKVVSFLEAMQATLSQSTTASTSTTPAQQTQLTEKALGFFQKAMAAWQPSANETFDQMKNVSLSLEEQRQRLELYCEIWVRLGCGAFRYHNAKQAIDCSERVLDPIIKGLSDKEQRVWVVETTWKWLAIAELLFGRSVLTLLSGETAAWTLIEAALTHLVSSIRFGLRAGASAVVLKASETAWNTVLSAMSAVEAERAVGESSGSNTEGQWWVQLLPLLREVLAALGQVSGASQLRGDFGLLLLDVCEKAKNWKVAVEIAESLMKASPGEVSADQLKDVTTFHAIALATMGAGSTSSGSSSGGNSAASGGGKAKDQDPMMKAKIMRQIAFSSWRHPPSQLKALATAHKELEGNAEEQALALMDIAEWFYTHQFPVREVEAHLEPALGCLIRGQLQSQESQQEKKDRPPSGGAKNGADSSGSYSPLWFAEKLLRGFIMRATIASSMPQRWEYIQNAMQQVFAAWQSILDTANEHDLRERFASEPAGDETIEFESWRIGKSTKYQAHCPHTVVEWVAFYQQYATSVSTRFYSQWLTALAVLKGGAGVDGSRQSVSNPILTCSVLERLLRLLSSHCASELALPVLCLYQVVYHAFSTQKSRAVEIWMELTLYEVLENLNLTTWNVPLQSALELLQSGGDTILKELQQQEHSDNASEETEMHHRRRAVLKLSQVNITEKVAQTIELLLQLGYVRQAKVLLAMLQSLADRATSSKDAVAQCIALTAQVYELEGAHEKARNSLQLLITATPSPLELSAFVKQVQLYNSLFSDPHKATSMLLNAEHAIAVSIMAANECVLLNQPMHAQAISKYRASLSASTSRRSTSVEDMGVDLDAITNLAQIKSQRACLLLSSSSSVASVEHAQRVFKDAMDLLAHVESLAVRAQLTVAFATRLIDIAFSKEELHEHIHGQHRHIWLLEARSQLREALVWQESLRARTFEPSQDERECPVVTIPLDIQIAETKIQLVVLELRLEESATIISELQMTWYAYDRHTKRTIVEKWLDQTAERAPIERPGSVTRAFALGSSVSSMLHHGVEQLQIVSLPQALQLRSQRLALYHSENVEQRKAVHKLLWTRFTSENAPHATWFCAANEGVSTTEEGRSTPSPAPDTGEKTAPVDPQDSMLLEQLEKLSASLEVELKQAMERRHGDVVRMCAYELVQVYGCTQPSLCVRALLLYQSSVVLDHIMKPLVERCLPSANVSKLHMKRVERLLKHHTNAQRNSLPFQLSQLYLDQQSDIYKRMSVFVPVETIASALPTNIRVLSLQLSPDQCFLYAAMPGSNHKGVAVARMECTKPKLDSLTRLKKRIRAWRVGMTQALSRGDDNATTGQRPQSDASDYADPAQPDASDELETEFNAIVNDMTELLGPLFEHSALAGALNAELPGNSLVLILDRELEVLPLEAMPAFDKADAISREFSIHLLYHRLTAVKAQPFRKEDVRVIVDPRQEDTGLNDQSLTSVLHQFTKKQGAAFTGWKDAVDHGQVPTETDWQQAMLMRRGGTLLYMGPNRGIGSTMALSTLAGMNLSSACYALLLLDRAENPTSARRQSKVDSEKARWELELEEDPYVCALLSSLCGINVVVLNQWTTTFNATRTLATGFLGGLAKGQSIAKALRKYPEGVSPVGVAPEHQPPFKASVAGVGATAASPTRLKNRIRYNTVVFGLGHLSFKANE